MFFAFVSSFARATTQKPIMADMDTSDQRTLWVGDIEQWMDETYVMNLFAHVAEVVNVKLIRDKTTMIPSGMWLCMNYIMHRSYYNILI